MKCVELNRKGNFDNWDLSILSELDKISNDRYFNEYSIFENEYLKCDVILLEPYERMPFKVLKNDFKLICLSGGLALSRFSNGRISLLMFEKGEYYAHNLGIKPMVNDLQNIGDCPLVMTLIEEVRGKKEEKSSRVVLNSDIQILT